MRVICEGCEKESNEADMDSDSYEHMEGGEDWSNHICPHCDFWNHSPTVWDARRAGKDLADLRVPK
jgi:hypothetical protein